MHPLSILHSTFSLVLDHWNSNNRSFSIVCVFLVRPVFVSRGLYSLFRAVARALIGEGVNIHIFVLCLEFILSTVKITLSCFAYNMVFSGQCPVYRTVVTTNIFANKEKATEAQ